MLLLSFIKVTSNKCPFKFALRVTAISYIHGKHPSPGHQHYLV